MTTVAQPTRLARLAQRLGLTEGQAYTVSLLAAVAVVLMASLGDLTGRIADAIAAPTTFVAPTTILAPSTSVDVPEANPVPLPALGPSALPPDVPAPSPSAPSPPSTVAVIPVEMPSESPERTCPASALTTPIGDAVRAIDAIVGGVVPDGTIVSALAIVTGCSSVDPAILLLASLIEVGQGLPDLGLGFLEIPALPFLEVPAVVVELVQPVRSALDPICNTVATVNLITSQVGPHYQAPFDALLSVSLFYALTTCGQIQDA